MLKIPDSFFLLLLLLLPLFFLGPVLHLVQGFVINVCMKYSCRKWHASKRYLNKSTEHPVNLRMLSIRDTLNAKIFLFVALSCLCRVSEWVYVFLFLHSLCWNCDRTFLLSYVYKSMLWITRDSWRMIHRRNSKELLIKQNLFAVHFHIVDVIANFSLSSACTQPMR